MSLLTQDRFFVNQKAKLIEITNHYDIRDESGNALGQVQEVGQSKARKVLRFATNIDQFLSHRYELTDASGARLAELTRPGTIWKSKVLIKDGTGRDVGSLAQKKVFGKVNFEITGAMGEKLGEIRAENWRAWDFAIVDAGEREIGRVTKKWAGAAKEIFTTADNYMVELDPSVQGDLRLMTVAAAACVDTALKQYEG